MRARVRRGGRRQPEAFERSNCAIYIIGLPHAWGEPTGIDGLLALKLSHSTLLAGLASAVNQYLAYAPHLDATDHQGCLGAFETEHGALPFQRDDLIDK